MFLCSEQFKMVILVRVFSQNALLPWNSNYGFEILLQIPGSEDLSLCNNEKANKKMKTGIAGWACFDVNKTITF